LELILLLHLTEALPLSGMGVEEALLYVNSSCILWCLFSLKYLRACLLKAHWIQF